MTDQPEDYQQTARDIIERMKSARPTCHAPDGCQRLWETYASGAYGFHMQQRGHVNVPITRELVNDWMKSRGYELESRVDNYVRRCDACANARSFPWASKLDVARVAHMLEHDPRCQSSFELSILEETLQPRSKECPCGLGVRCALESEGVGSTGLCIKCLLLRGLTNECVCPPVPYRNAIITGICKLEHERNGKDCKYERAEPTDKPRKGFEFL